MFEHIVEFYSRKCTIPNMKRIMFYRWAMRPSDKPRDKNPGRKTEAGKAYMRTYNSWRDMIARCTDPKAREYRNYGRRGIAVNPDWLDFKTFLADMGWRPAGMSLDRKNNNLGYSRDNCRWATREEQGNNKRNNVFLEYNGRKLTLAQWEQELGIAYQSLKYRLAKGWSIEKTLTTPSTRQKSLANYRYKRR